MGKKNRPSQKNGNKGKRPKQFFAGCIGERKILADANVLYGGLHETAKRREQGSGEQIYEWELFGKKRRRRWGFPPSQRFVGGKRI